MMKHKGYIGKVEYDYEAKILHGEVINTRDVITFQGTNAEEIEIAFKESVEDYIEFCRSEGEEPEKPYSGNFMVRMSSEQHKMISIAANASGTSLNAWVADHLSRDAEEELSKKGITPERLIFS